MFTSNKQKKLAKIRAQWGKEKESYINLDSARYYFDQKPTGNDFQVIDDRLANDLDLDRVFPKLDRTTSKIGQQYLYDKLRRPTNEVARLQEFEGRVQHFGQATDDREKVQLLLSELHAANDYYFPLLIFGELPTKPSWLKWAHLLQGISVGSLVFSIFYPVAFLAFCIILPINLFLHYRNKNRLGRFSATFSRFNFFFRASQKMIPFATKKEQAEAKAHFGNLKIIFRKIGWLKLDSLQEQEALAPLWFLVEVLKIITLSELITFYKVLDDIDRYRPSIHFVFQMVGQIDAAISVASYRISLPYFQLPQFSSNQKALQIAGALHPLLTEGIPNDLQLQHKSILLTGSNMSGKTTFIRTVGLNVILAQSIMTPICKSYRAPFFRLGSSIRIQDDVEEDKSYYLEEVTVIGELIKAAEKTEPYLFIIDEMFKGTNTLERVSAAKAVLSYLNQGDNIVLISTHDIELTDYLSEEYDLYFFQETVEDSVLTFDYKLKKGKLQQKNAIKILEIMDYPKVIIEEANRMAQRQD